MIVRSIASSWNLAWSNLVGPDAMILVFGNPNSFVIMHKGIFFNSPIITGVVFRYSSKEIRNVVRPEQDSMVVILEHVVVHPEINSIFRSNPCPNIPNHLVIFQHSIPRKAKPEAIVAMIGKVVPIDVFRAEGGFKSDIGAIRAVIFFK